MAVLDHARTDQRFHRLDLATVSRAQLERIVEETDVTSLETLRRSEGAELPTGDVGTGSGWAWVGFRGRVPKSLRFKPLHTRADAAAGAESGKRPLGRTPGGVMEL